jgi:hypothetical protein
LKNIKWSRYREGAFLIYADGGYSEKLLAWAHAMFGWVVEVVKFPKRWVVERTFAWLANYRRLNRDDELNPRQSEAMIKLAMIHLLLKRIARYFLRQPLRFRGDYYNLSGIHGDENRLPSALEKE